MLLPHFKSFNYILPLKNQVQFLVHSSMVKFVPASLTTSAIFPQRPLILTAADSLQPPSHSMFSHVSVLSDWNAASSVFIHLVLPCTSK